MAWTREQMAERAAQELRDGRLVRLRTPALEAPRRTLMIYRDHGYQSHAARELIALVRSFNWNGEGLDTTAVA